MFSWIPQISKPLCRELFAHSLLFCYKFTMENTANKRVVILGGGAVGSVLAAALAGLALWWSLEEIQKAPI